jgi:hypothetical protein
MASIHSGSSSTVTALRPRFIVVVHRLLIAVIVSAEDDLVIVIRRVVTRIVRDEQLIAIRQYRAICRAIGYWVPFLDATEPGASEEDIAAFWSALETERIPELVEIDNA